MSPWTCFYPVAVRALQSWVAVEASAMPSLPSLCSFHFPGGGSRGRGTNSLESGQINKARSSTGEHRKELLAIRKTRMPSWLSKFSR